MRVLFIALLLLCSLPSNVLLAQPGSQVPSKLPAGLDQQYTILGISVEGAKTGSPDVIIAQSGLRRGMTYTVPSDAMRRAVQQLFGQNIYNDVQIIVEKQITQSDGTIGTYLVIKLQELSRLNQIRVSGNSQVKTSEIEKEIRLRTFEFVRPWELQEASRRIKALYQKEGYYYADVRFEQSKPATDTLGLVDLLVEINEGSEVKVRSIDIVGNTELSDGDLKGAMDATSESRWWKIFSSSSFDPKGFEEDKKRIIAYYHARGFRDAAIISDSIWVDNGRDMHIQINVHEGHRYYLRNIDVAGNNVFTDEEIRQHLGFATGDIYNIEKFDLNMRGPSPDFSDVGSLYYDKGYMVNVAKEETTIGNDSIDVVLRIQEGKQHFLRYVDVQGNTRTKDYVVRRELFTRPGEPFSRAAIIRSLRQLAQLNYFNQEKLVPDVRMPQDATSTDIDIVYQVEERSSDTFNASIGYGGSLGLTGSVGVSFNNFDLRDPLHGGGGQILNLTAEFGAQQYRTLSLSFSEPWLFQKPTALGFSLYNTHSSYLYTIDRSGASLSVGRRFRWPDDYFRGDWTLAGQKSNIEFGGAYYAAGRHDEVSIQQILSRISTDNPIFPTSGSEFSLLNRIAYLPLKSVAPNEPSNYFKNSLTMRFFTPLWAYKGQNKLVLATSADVGQLGGIGSDPYIPPTERFTMGGSGLATGFYTIPLRGYDDAAIGIQRSPGNNFAEGGLAYTRYLAELRYILALEPIPVYFLGFAEAGNVWRDFSHADLFTLKRAAGIGARVQVPAVGLLGIDYGYGFDPLQTFGEPSGWKVHFQFGRGF